MAHRSGLCLGKYVTYDPEKSAYGPGLPDFSWYMIPKLEKMYQMNTKYNKWSKNIPNVRKIFQMAIKYINLFPSEVLQNFPK
jgi:hypothetical protein